MESEVTEGSVLGPVLWSTYVGSMTMYWMEEHDLHLVSQKSERTILEPRTKKNIYLKLFGNKIRLKQEPMYLGVMFDWRLNL